MKVEQLHYTSCRHGRSGHAGFQVRATSPGLGAHVVQEIERLAGYRPPRDLPPQPTPKQIAEEFPVALRYAPLPEGRAVLLRAAYCGRDYSNRWGNFFTHALVFDSDDLGDAWPVDYADWSGWRGCLEADEDQVEAAGDLASLQLPTTQLGGPFGWDELRDFLAEDAERPRRLVEMGRAVLLAEKDSRRLVVRDLRTACWYWVACITKLFPPRHARRLGFSTYEDDPRGAARINATCGETDFTFDDTQRRFQFYAFDLVADSHSEVPTSADDYPAVAASWLIREPERLLRFFSFMNLFDHAEPSAELNAALRLFEVSEGGALPEGEELQGVIRFAVTYATGQGRRRIVEQVARSVDAVHATLGGEERQALLRFFTDVAAVSGLLEHREIAYRMWLGTVDAVLEGRIEPAVGRAGEELLRTRLTAHRRELAELFLETLPPQAVEGRRPDIALYLLRATGRMLDLLGRTSAWKQDEIQRLARSFLAGGGELVPRLVPLFELAQEAAEGVELFCLLAVETGSSGEEVGRALARFLAGRPVAFTLDVRRRLDRQATWPVLFGEWLQICEQSADLVAAYRQYQRTVLKPLPGYGEAYGSRITSSILGALPEKNRLPLVREWLASGEVTSFPDDLAERCLDVANHAVDLLIDGEEADRWSRQVAEMAAARNIVLRPDRPALREDLRSLQAGRGIPDTAVLQAHLAALPSGEYRQVVTAVLPPTLGHVSDPDLHRTLLLAFQRSDEAGAHTEAYRSFLSSHRRGRWPPSLAAALGFYLNLDPVRADGRRLAALERPLRSALKRTLRHLNKDAFHRICREQRKGGLSRRANRWSELEATVRRLRRGVLGRLKDLVRHVRKKGGTRV